MTTRMFFLLLFAFASQANAESLTVTKKEYGEKWPYTVSAVEMFCFENSVLIDAHGVRYALNGKARSRYKDLYLSAKEIANPHPLSKEAVMPPPRGLIQRGLDLCR